MSFKIAGYNDTKQDSTNNNDFVKYADVFGSINVKEKATPKVEIKQEPPKQQPPKQVSATPSKKVNTAAPQQQQQQQPEQETIVDRMADWAANVDLKGAKDKSVPLLMKVIAPIRNKISKQIAIVAGNNLMKDINKEFRHGSTVTARGFRFRSTKKIMMLLEYSGADATLKIPDTVANRPITAIKSGFMAGKALTRVKKLRLPMYLEVLPKNLFENAKALEVIVVQKNVTTIVPDAFASVHPRVVYFMGQAPKGLALAGLSSRTIITCKKAYSASYKGIPNLKIMK